MNFPPTRKWRENNFLGSEREKRFLRSFQKFSQSSELFTNISKSTVLPPRASASLTRTFSRAICLKFLLSDFFARNYRFFSSEKKISSFGVGADSEKILIKAVGVIC